MKENSVLVIKPGTSPEAIADYINGGPLPPGAHEEDFETYTARGRVSDCDCQLISCVCVEARQHEADCQWRKAITCAIPINCEPHGRDACPECDKCTCRLSRFERVG